MSFEIIDANGNRLRYEGKEFIWQYASKDGEPDKLDKSVVEVLNTKDDEVVFTVHNPLVVGDVGFFTALIMPKEKRTTQCPRCGYSE